MDILLREELQHVFDGLVDKMFKLVDDQLERLQITHTMEEIVELILKTSLSMLNLTEA